MGFLGYGFAGNDFSLVLMPSHSDFIARILLRDDGNGFDGEFSAPHHFPFSVDESQPVCAVAQVKKLIGIVRDDFTGFVRI
jgi:hypothetical protein